MASTKETNGVANGSDKQGRHPSAAGFENAKEQTTPVELTVHGTLPSFVQGTLYRTGPGAYSVDGCDKVRILHWFDGFTLNHQFTIRDGKVLYRSKFAVDQVLEQVRKTQSLTDVSFAKYEPCQTLWKKFFTAFTPLTGPTGPSSINIGVTLAANQLPLGTSHQGAVKTLFARTDTKMLQELDPETLMPLSIKCYHELHPDLSGPLSAAHGEFDPETGEYFNFVLDLGPSPVYRVFETKPGDTRILAAVHTTASYLHSFFLTKKYVVLACWNADIVRYGMKILWDRNILSSIGPWNADRPAHFYVISRKEGGVVATYDAPAFFAFHTINAWDQGDDVVCDVSTYVDHSILYQLWRDMLMGKASDQKYTPAIYQRFTLADVSTTPGGKAHVETVSKAMVELPVINGQRHMQAHRYVYGIHSTVGNVATALVKIDNTDGEFKVWSLEGGGAPSEPIFVARPGASKEDDGILLTVVLDNQRQRSMLMVLDAASMTEVARAEMAPGKIVPFGFHGTFV